MLPGIRQTCIYIHLTMKTSIFWIFLLSFLCFVCRYSMACSLDRCGDCVTRDPQCAWCYDEEFNSTQYSRCGTKAELMAAGCSSYTTGPVPEITFLQNNSLNDGSNGPAVQLYPQKVKIRLRPGETFKWYLKYKLAKNFPVDIYFLTDPSFTMISLKEQLSNFANDLAISNLTNDYRFGFGTAMDKVTLPFSHTTAKALQDPCLGNAPNCDPPYDFIHRYTLSSDVPTFVSTVRATRSTANYDAPEGGFDGLMQVLVCTQEIGWRNKSRRLLLYATDSDFHFAGDGRLAGIVKPNDGACHLDNNKRYTHGLIQDYPSVGQLIKATRDNNINLIFAITSTSKALYDHLSNLIPEATTSELSSDSRNILEIIKTNYENIRRSIELRYDPAPKDITIEFWTNCGKLNRPIDKKAKCVNINEKEDSEIQFEVWLISQLNACPSDSSERTQKFVISPVGLQEQIEIEVEYICECDCQKPGQVEINSARCNNGTGNFECGICHCDEGWTGTYCDCDETKSEEEACGTLDENDNTTIKICNDIPNSRCVCGKCECPQDYTGQFCECYNAGCDYHNGAICGGPSNGQCVCGKCVCEPEFTGEKCDCPVSDDECKTMSGGNETICNGNGECVCGKCVCSGKYRGSKCKDCPTCPGFCAQYRPCAECKAFQQGSLTKDECDKQCEHTTVADKIDDKTENFCRFPDSSGCYFTFTYAFDENEMVSIVVKKTKDDCPTEANVALIGGGIAGAIFLVALLLLIIWKIFTTCYDSMEYARYQREIDNPDFSRNENPIFKSPVSKFENPMYDVKSPEPDKVDF